MPELARLTWQEAREALSVAELAVVPIGSCEQHGPHMTLDSDFAIADGFARRLVDRLEPQALLCPPLPYGLSEHHLAFAGTLTLRPATMLATVHDVIESLHGWGIDRLVFVNGHGGNIEALRLAAREARRDHGVVVASIMWSVLAAAEIAQSHAGGTYGHACEIETSVALALAPHVVRKDLIGAPAPPVSVLAPTMPNDPRVDLPVPFQDWTRNGALGDARDASLELGQTIVEIAMARALELCRALVASAQQDASG